MMGNTVNKKTMSRLRSTLVLILLTAALGAGARVSAGQSSTTLTPTEREIEKQRLRLTSAEEEERRDAVMRLGAMHLPAASRVCLSALADAAPIIRAVAAKAILSLSSEESSGALIPLLKDKNEFVRRETAYALGLTHSRTATSVLSDRLVNDKEDGVRGAAAVALGEIADEGAVVSLVGVLEPQSSSPSKGKRRRKNEQNPFVLRAVAVALGQIRSRAGVPALIDALTNETLPDDVRREAARALGLIGDRAALPALRIVSSAADPYLSRLAFESLRKISP
jgi:HEAT repeat protein